MPVVDRNARHRLAERRQQRQRDVAIDAHVNGTARCVALGELTGDDELTRREGVLAMVPIVFGYATYAVSGPDVEVPCTFRLVQVHGGDHVVPTWGHDVLDAPRVQTPWIA